MKAVSGGINGQADVAAGRVPALVARLRQHAASLIALFVRLAAAGIAYALQIALARMLGANDYGVFAYAWAWVTIGGFAATFGYGQISVRFLAHYSETGSTSLARGFVRASLGIVALGSAGLAAVGLALLLTFPDMLAQAYFLPMVLALAAFPFFAVGDLAEGYARSQGWSLLALVPPYIVRQALLLAALPAVYLLGVAPTATIAMAAALIATVLTTLVQLALVTRRLFAALPAQVGAAFENRGWFSAAWPVFLADSAQVLRQSLDVLILACFVTPSEVALYFAATRVASLLGLVEFAVGATAAHRFARITDPGDTITLRRLAREAATLTFWPTLLAAIAVAIAARFVLALFGAEYVASANLVLILAAGYALRALIGPAEEFLTMRGHGRAVLLAQIFGLEATAGLCLALIPEFGALGAAIGSFGAMATTTLALAYACHRQTGVIPLPVPTRSPSIR